MGETPHYRRRCLKTERHVTPTIFADFRPLFYHLGIPERHERGMASIETLSQCFSTLGFRCANKTNASFLQFRPKVCTISQQCWVVWLGWLASVDAGHCSIRDRPGFSKLTQNMEYMNASLHFKLYLICVHF